MPRRQLTELIFYPAGNPLELYVIVIHGRDNIGHHLDMHAPFVFGPPGDLKYSLPVPYPGQIAVKGIRETLNIDPPGVEIWPDGIQRLGTEVAIGHIGGIEVILLGQPGRVQGIFEPDAGLIVCPGNTPALVAFRQLDSGFGLNFPGAPPRLTGLGTGDFPVLAVLAVEITAPATDGESEAGGEEVEQGLFFNRVSGD